MTELKQQELVALAKVGSQRATTELFTKMRPLMIKSMTKKFRTQFSNAEIEDAIQESFVKAFSNLDKYKPNYTFNTWLYKICNNTLIDYSRKAHKRAINFSLDVENDSENEVNYSMANYLFDENPNPEEKLEKEQVTEFAFSILEHKAIPEKLRDIAILLFMFEKSYDEISEELDMPLGTVKSRIKRFKEKASELINHNIVGNYHNLKLAV